MSSSSPNPAVSGTPITALHTDIIQSHILNRLDGPTLASTTCASTQFLSLCKDDQLWRDICNSTWPSTSDPRVRETISTFPAGHRSFYSDSYPALRHQLHPKNTHQRRGKHPSELISAVDIYCDEKLVYSKVIVTETISNWFISSPFRLDLLDPKETVHTPIKFEGENENCVDITADRLRVSWILIDPVNKRAVNIASLKPVEARRHWLTEDVQLRYATVTEGNGGEMVQCGVMVTCGGKDGGDLHVREVSMQVEDMEGKTTCGMDGLGILQDAMEGYRCKVDGRMEKSDYEMFLRKKIECRERKTTRERNLDMLCIATGVSIFFAIWMFFLAR